MANLDARVASLLDHPPPGKANTARDSDDEDALIAALEDSDTEPSALRERRLEQLHAEFVRAKSLRNQNHGTYSTLSSEKEILDVTTSTKLCVVHFFKADFKRCRIMDEHLKTLAERHLDTRFLRADVESVPWLVQRLQVQVLPCVIAFIDAKSVDRLVGFEGVGRGTDAVTTSEVETRLVASGVLVRQKMEGEGGAKNRYDGLGNDSKVTRGQDEDDEDDDWD